MFKAILIIFFLSISNILLAQIADEKILGTYLSPKKNAKILIYKNEGKFFGKFIWLEKPDKDTKNPDESLRDREVLGMIFLKDFKSNGNHSWNNGSIYDPESGVTYKSKAWFEENNFTKLYLRGFVGFSLLGRTEVFERVN